MDLKAKVRGGAYTGMHIAAIDVRTAIYFFDTCYISPFYL
jgi:hypothetical protein